MKLCRDERRSWDEIGWEVCWRRAKVLQTCGPPPQGKRRTSWVNGEVVVGRSRYAPAVKNWILRGQGLIRLGRGVPMVITVVTKALAKRRLLGRRGAESWEISESGRL